MRLPNIRRESVFAYRGILILQLAIAAWCFPVREEAGFGAAALDLLPFALCVACVVLLLRARLLIGRRIAAGEAAERERRRLLLLDPLTGVLSRRSFMDALGEVVRFGMPKPVSLLLVDVDHFKAVNDGFGHATGDEVLRHLVGTARRSFPDAVVGRLGGDEFALLLDLPLDPESSSVVDAFLAALRLPQTIAGRSMSIGASIGVAAAPLDACLPDELLGCADLALYESKRRGRCCATSFDRSMMREEMHRRSVERELRAAILLDELELHYQPLVDMNGNCVAVEALVRWRHPVRGMVPPGDFVEIAEKSTLIDALGEWVLRRAARDAAHLGRLTIGVNVSGAQLKRDEVIAMVRRVLAETGCTAERFVFEITESVAFAATPAVLSRLQALRDMGAKVSLDDFGTGSNGFQSLRSLPIDSIKVDRSYIQAMGEDPVASVLVSAVGSIGRIQRIEVIAEGIESQDHRILAQAAGCTLFQGYHFGRPQALARFLADAPPLSATA